MQHTFNVLVIYITELKIYATLGGLYNISYQINSHLTPPPRWPHRVCSGSTLPSIIWLCADFCFYRHREMVVHYVVTRWHGMPCFTFKESKDVTLQGLVQFR